MSAALWCDELGLSALLLEKSDALGGQLLWTFNRIKNHLGIEAENGRELRDKFVGQIENRNFSICLQAEITGLDLDKKIVRLENGEEFSARALIIATGVRRRKLGIAGEDKFKDRGILTSGKRDKDSVKDKRIIIVGGGDAALENALILAETASEIKIVHRRKEFRAHAEFFEAARQNPKIEFLSETVVNKIAGNERIEAVELKNLPSGKNYIIPTDAILIRIGVEPNTDFLRGKLESDKNGYLKTDLLCKTNITGIWAIGDVANPVSPTVSSAVGMGATAVKNLYIWLNE